MAAVQAKRLGHSVVLLAFGAKLGGMTSGGLGATDIGNKAAIGGLAREFYEEIGKHYGKEIQWTFEPHVAEKVFHQFLERERIPVYFEQHLASVVKEGNEITEITMEDGSSYRAKIFIDATYEGDLLAAAGVSFHVGREGNAAYDETYAGVQYGGPYHNFRQFVDPYKIAGTPGSGLLAGISDAPMGVQGEGDHRVQAYNFRMCLTQRDDNRIPFFEPRGYDPERYTLFARYLATGVWDALRLTTAMPNEKTDTNNYGGFSSDNIGMNYQWPEGDYQTREAVFQDHVSYHQGMFWFLTQDERVPCAVREEVRRWGLPKDEFMATGGWPHELYIREGRRMIASYVMTEHNCVGRFLAPDSVGLAAYAIDSHHCQRVVLGGRVRNEGDVEIGGGVPYPISYRSIVPREEECANLLVPFCLSASHIAFGSIRMEPVFMVLAQSAATAADLAIRGASPVQKVDYPSLRKKLLEDRQVLEPTPESLQPPRA